MTTGLALTRPEPIMDHQSLELMLDQAERYVASGLLPASIKTPQQALIIMAQGRELGIPSTVALRGIVVVQGKPTCSAELMMALVHRTYGQSAMRVFRTDNEACTVQYRQQGWDGVSEYTFTMDDAKRANLLKNPTWNQYPAAMLRARAISATVRFAFPECISGVYTPEELGADVTIVDGEAIPTGNALAAPGRTGAEDGAASGWNATAVAKWESGVEAARAIGAAVPQKPAPDAPRSAVVAALKTLAVRVGGRRALIEELDSAVKLANAYGEDGGAFAVPDDLPDLDDDEVRELIDAATRITEAATAVPA